MSPSINDVRLNRGEWGEFYVMLKLLGEGRLYTANNLLIRDLNNYLDVLKVIRQEQEDCVLEYVTNGENVLIKRQEDGSVLAEAPSSEFIRNSRVLFEHLTTGTGRTMSAPESVCNFARFIYVNKPKAPAVEALKRRFGGKNDIFLEARDSQTSIVSVMGFSIKSKFGNPPTLFNAGTSSQFVYKLSHFSDEEMNEFNSISDEKGRAWNLCKDYLRSKNVSLEYSSTKGNVYRENLFLVRELMEKIIAWCVRYRLIEDCDNNRVKEVTEAMAYENPLNVPSPEIYYEKAIKDFLMAGFSGMTAGKQWDGREQVSGGYIVVTEDGEVICYHSNDREGFRDYLYRNTFFEYVSSGKYQWSYIEKNGDSYYLPLNISIRFDKNTR